MVKPSTKKQVTLPIKSLLALSSAILENRGTPPGVAKKVVLDLIKNEASGYGSHGLLRLFEYLDLIASEQIIPTHSPKLEKKNAFVTQVNGENSFGVLCAQSVSEALISHLTNNQFGIVTLVRSGHLGRLWSIASQVCSAGGVLIGFSNLSGAGQNVLPFGGEEGRLCTNPILFGIPSKPPLIVDMSTSSVSEGKLRELWKEGEALPEEWLCDKEGNSIEDAVAFYSRPQKAFLSPLGGKSFGYKGFSLALVAEIFAGIFTGGGFSQLNSSNITNSAFFLTFHPDLLSLSLQELEEKTNLLIDYLKTAYKKETLHIPGWETHYRIKDFNEENKISINKKLFDRLKKYEKLKIH